MKNRDSKKLIEQDDAFDTQKLLEGVNLSGVMEEIELEEILSEYGNGKKAARTPKAVEEEVWVNQGYKLKPVQTEKAKKKASSEQEPIEKTAKKKKPPVKKTHAAEFDPEPQAVYHPQEKETKHREKQQKENNEDQASECGIPLEDVMAQVVDAVMEEEEAKREVAQPVVRRGLFSRKLRTFEDTEPLGRMQQKPEDEKEVSYVEEPEEDPIDDTPERSSDEATADYHQSYKHLRKRSKAALICAVCACIFAGIQYSGAAGEYLTFTYSAIASIVLSAVQLMICFPVLQRGVIELFHGKCKPELLVSIFALVTIADGASIWLVEGRSAQLPLGAVAAVALYFTMRGEMLRLRGLRDSCHMATYDKQPYVISSVVGGFRKQSCTSEGYIKMADQESEQAGWYHMLLPVILVATIVFAALTAVNRFDMSNFLWYWSAILGAASSFAFTAAFGSPIGKLARRLQRDGCAVAGYSGAEMMSKKGSMILTDQDLFPPGTVFMNGMKVYAHDMLQSVSYATSLIDASGCGLRQVFDDLCRGQGGHSYPVDDFSFYQEGGLAGVIRGESVILGRSDFMAKMGVRLPKDMNLKTGVFLAVDKELAAVFAIKYMPSDNVDAALQAVLHNGIQPVFAVRDFNITPALIKRKFKINTKKRCLYPDLSDRLALSEEEYEGNGRPGALLFREGLMPYAETVIGGKRMHGAVCKSCAWALIGSICGTLLAFYLVFVSGFTILTPLALLVFQTFWAIPSAMVNGWVSQY